MFQKCPSSSNQTYFEGASEEGVILNLTTSGFEGF